LRLRVCAHVRLLHLPRVPFTAHTVWLVPSHAPIAVYGSAPAAQLLPFRGLWFTYRTTRSSLPVALPRTRLPRSHAVTHTLVYAHGLHYRCALRTVNRLCGLRALLRLDFTGYARLPTVWLRFCGSGFCTVRSRIYYIPPLRLRVYGPRCTPCTRHHWFAPHGAAAVHHTGLVPGCGLPRFPTVCGYLYPVFAPAVLRTGSAHWVAVPARRFSSCLRLCLRAPFIYATACRFGFTLRVGHARIYTHGLLVYHFPPCRTVAHTRYAPHTGLHLPYYAPRFHVTAVYGSARYAALPATVTTGSTAVTVALRALPLVYHGFGYLRTHLRFTFGSRTFTGSHTRFPTPRAGSPHGYAPRGSAVTRLHFGLFSLLPVPLV